MRALSKILFALLLLLHAAPTLAAPATAVISGTVYGAGGQPAPNTVVVFNLQQQIIGGNLIRNEIVSTRTDQNGAISPITLPQAAVVQITVGTGIPVTGIVPLAEASTFEMVLAGSVFSGGAFRIENVNISNQSALNFTEGANISITNPSGSDVEIGLTGIVPVSLGGTGLANITQYGVLVGGGAGPVTVSGPGTSGYCFVGNGAGAAPTFQPCPGPPTSGTVVSVGLSLPAIFSVTGSPVTTTGTLAATLATQTANLVFAGPTSGGAAAPTFRALVAADIPSHSAALITSGTLPVARGGTGQVTLAAEGILYGGGVSGVGVTGTGTAGQCLRSNGGGGNAPSFQNCDGITSVGLSLPGIFSVSGSPITSSGTLTAVFNSQSANRVFAAPSGSDGQPSFRVLTAQDMPVPIGQSNVPQLALSHMPPEGATIVCNSFPLNFTNGILTSCN